MKVRFILLLAALWGLGCDGKDGLFHIGDEPPRPPRPPVPGQPSFGATVVAEDPPPPISGGTLAVTRGGLAVAADPDGDLVTLVTIDDLTLPRHVALQPHDEPGRVVLDEKGHAFVALRRGGAVVTIDLAQGAVTDRRAVCAAPRGLAYAAEGDLLHVACAGGELVTLAAAGGAPVRTLTLDPDLRDVVVDGDSLFVSRFRAAEVLVVDARGVVVGRHAPPAFSSGQVRRNAAFAPTVAWRMFARQGGGVWLVHQRSLQDPVPTGPPAAVAAGGSGYYGADGFPGCRSGVVHGTVTAMGRSGYAAGGSVITNAVLPVDAAAGPSELAVVAAGNSYNGGPGLFMMRASATSDDCDGPAVTRMDLRGQQAVAVAWPAGGPVVVQLRRQRGLVVIGKNGTLSIPLASGAREDTGHQIFHANSSAGLACASCHPEGGDDGHTWVFQDVGKRRTQYLRGGVLRTAPFHWSGDLGDFRALYEEVMLNRMAGPELSSDRVDALGGWIDRLPAVRAATPKDPAAVERGRAVFQGGAGCAACHDGALHTNNRAEDVGTGERLQVPALVDLAARTRFMHDGCAEGLATRFSPTCGGGDKHGRISQLTAPQLADLIAYLETL